MVAPVATPALIWATLAAGLSLAFVIVQLFIMAAMSNWLSHITVHACQVFEDGGDGQTIGKSWNTGPRSG